MRNARELAEHLHAQPASVRPWPSACGITCLPVASHRQDHAILHIENMPTQGRCQMAPIGAHHIYDNICTEEVGESSSAHGRGGSDAAETEEYRIDLDVAPACGLRRRQRRAKKNKHKNSVSLFSTDASDTGDSMAVFTSGSSGETPCTVDLSAPELALSLIHI